jgi:hypothetical protein
VGGLPLKKFYPELANAALWCCTELTTRTAIDNAVGLLHEGSARSANERPAKERSAKENQKEEAAEVTR